MSAEPRQLLLCAGDALAVDVVDGSDWRDRVMTCGCVSRGRWAETSHPPLRVWLGYTKRPCGAHMPRVRGKVER